MSDFNEVKTLVPGEMHPDMFNGESTIMRLDSIPVFRVIATIIHREGRDIAAKTESEALAFVRDEIIDQHKINIDTFSVEVIALRANCSLPEFPEELGLLDEFITRHPKEVIYES